MNNIFNFDCKQNAQNVCNRLLYGWVSSLEPEANMKLERCHIFAHKK